MGTPPFFRLEGLSPPKMEGKPPLLSDFPYLDYSTSPIIRQSFSLFLPYVTQLNIDNEYSKNKYKKIPFDCDEKDSSISLVINTNHSDGDMASSRIRPESSLLLLTSYYKK